MNNLHLKNTHDLILDIVQNIKTIGLQDSSIKQKLESLSIYIRTYPYSLASIVFGGTITYLRSKEIEREPEILEKIIKELKGEKANWDTIAVKHDFTVNLTEDLFDLYNALSEIVLLVKRGALEKGEIELINIYIDDVYNKLKEEIPDDIAGLVIITAWNVLLKLPTNYPEQFSMSDERGGYISGFSSIGSRDIIVDINEHVSYIIGLLDKIKGEKTLYIDVSSVSGYYILNVR